MGGAGGLFKLGEHTADGYGLGFHSVAPCGELFVLFLLGAEAFGEVIVMAALFVLGDGRGGVLHHRLPYHLGEEIHLPLASLNVIVNKIGVRQRFLHVAEGVDGCPISLVEHISPYLIKEVPKNRPFSFFKKTRFCGHGHGAPLFFERTFLQLCTTLLKRILGCVIMIMQ